MLSLDSPIDGYAEQLFWVHMIQHVLLITVAPPLILLGRPWPRMWRALPLTTRTEVGRGAGPLAGRRSAARLARPLPAWMLFTVTLLAWHLPAAYNATLTSPGLHQLEHATFFFTGLLFWARVIDPGPAAPAADLAVADRLRGRCDDRRLAARGRARAAAQPGLQPLRACSPTGPAGSPP